jgi:excisionase family DNA binding protein
MGTDLTQHDLERMAYRPAEVAKILGISLRKVYALLDEGQLRSVSVNKARRSRGIRLISRTALEQMIGERE